MPPQQSSVLLVGITLIILLLLVLPQPLLALSPQPQSDVTAVVGAMPRLGNLTSIRVCVSSWKPFVYRDDRNQLTGYEIDLFTMVASNLGWNYTLSEYDWEDMMLRLMRPYDDPEACHMAPSSVPITTHEIYRGIRFSFPTVRNGLAIVTRVSGVKYDMWTFARVFDVKVWLLLIGSSFVLAWIIYAAERDMAARGMAGNHCYYSGTRVAAAFEAQYRVLGKVFNTVDDLRVTSLAAKLVALAWGLLVLVMISTYTAALTAKLTARNFVTPINSVNDLPSVRVVTWIDYVTLCKKFGFLPKGMDWATEKDGLKMLDMVARGEADALVFDEPWCRMQVATRCDLTIVGRIFQYINNAVAFNVATDIRDLVEYNTQLTTLMQSGTYETLEGAYIATQTGCGGGNGDGTMVVTLEQVSGVWVVLGATVGLALLILILPHLNKKLDIDALTRIKSMASMSMARTADLSIRSFKVKPMMGDSVQDVSMRSMTTSPTVLPTGLPSNHLVSSVDGTADARRTVSISGRPKLIVDDSISSGGSSAPVGRMMGGRIVGDRAGAVSFIEVRAAAGSVGFSGTKACPPAVSVDDADKV